jgi:hypothetical protein
MAAHTLKPLDAFLPEYEFSERHSTRVDASAARIDAAVRALAIEDVPLAHLLVRLRGLGRPTRQRRPFVESGRLLDDAPGEGVVLGLSGQFWKLRGGPGGGEAVIDFRIDGNRLSTETRVHVADPGERLRFARYWRVIRPFSGLIRVLFLREVRKQAEA